MKPCKHLDYSDSYPECELVEIEGFECPVRHWRRTLYLPGGPMHYDGAPVNVQFCKLRGRINGIFDCYNPGEMCCYEPAEEAP